MHNNKITGLAGVDEDPWRHHGKADELLDPLKFAIDAMLEYIDVNSDEETELDEFEIAKAKVLMCGYHAKWFAWARRVHVISVEAEFEGKLINPKTGKSSRTYTLGGKIDAIVMIDGKVFLIEHKTSSEDISPESMYVAKLGMDPQISTYHRGGESLGHKVYGTIYDIIKKPMLRAKKETPEKERTYTNPKPARPGKPCKDCKQAAIDMALSMDLKKPLVKDIPITEGCEECTLPKEAEESRLYSGQRDRDETPDEFADRIREAVTEDPEVNYRHEEVVRLEEELAEHDLDVWATALTMRNASYLGSHPRNLDGCERYKKLCEYWTVCRKHASIDDPLLFRDSQQHEELAQKPENDATVV